MSQAGEGQPRTLAQSLTFSTLTIFNMHREPFTMLEVESSSMAKQCVYLVDYCEQVCLIYDGDFCRDGIYPSSIQVFDRQRNFSQTFENCHALAFATGLVSIPLIFFILGYF